MDTEMVAMQIIASAGDGKGLAFDSLEAAKSGDFTKAYELLKNSEDASLDAHKAQTELLIADANGEKTPIDVLLVHSQDHLMTSILAQELIKELIQLYQRVDELEKKLGEK